MTAICVHSTPGRLRLRSAAVKNNVWRAETVETHLGQCVGVNRVEVNAVTGSVLVSFDPESASAQSLLGELRRIEAGKIAGEGVVRMPGRPSRQAGGVAMRQKVFRYAAEQIAERVIVFLILAVAA